MNNTEKNYTTNKTLEDYIRSNIDVHMKYLLFLNSFKDISNKGFIYIAPILDNITNELYTSFVIDSMPDDTIEVNKEVVNKISELFDKYDIPEVKKYIGYEINEKDIIKLSLATFIRKQIQSLSTNIDEIEHIDSNQIKVIIDSLEYMKHIKIKANIKVNGFSNELIGYYLEELKIEKNESSSIDSYMYQTLYNFNIISIMMKKLACPINENEINYLSQELYENSIIKSSSSITNLINILGNNLEHIKNKTQSYTLNLEKKD